MLWRHNKVYNWGARDEWVGPRPPAFFTEDEEIRSGLEIYKTHIIEGTFGEILRHALNSITLLYMNVRGKTNSSRVRNFLIVLNEITRIINLNKVSVCFVTSAGRSKHLSQTSDLRITGIPLEG